jgi:hypothetical protein
MVLEQTGQLREVGAAFGAPFYGLHRRALQELLAAAAGAEHLRLGCLPGRGPGLAGLDPRVRRAGLSRLIANSGGRPENPVVPLW